MALVNIGDFKFGMDRRRKRPVGTPGSLWTLKNAHITRGGDIERMKKWADYANLPAGTFGLEAVFGQLTVFGSEDLASSMPLPIQYQRLQPPAGSTGVSMVGILDSTVFDNKIYAIARFSDGSIHHYYNGVLVADWETIANGAVEPAWVVFELGLLVDNADAVEVVTSGKVLRLTSVTPGVPFTVAATGASAKVTTRVANVVGVSAQNATATIRCVTGPGTVPRVTGPGGVRLGVNVYLNSCMIGGIEHVITPILWRGTTDDMARQLAVAINARTGFSGYRADANGDVVTVTEVNGKGASVNGQNITLLYDTPLAFTTTPFVNGVTATNPVAQITDVVFEGAIDASTVLKATVNGTTYTVKGQASLMGTSCYSYKQRLWCTAGTMLRYSKLNDPSNWSDETAGFISMPNSGDGAERLVCMARYNDQVAVFSTNQIRMWHLDVDPLKNASAQTLANTGTVAPRGVVQYGDMDVFYLATQGIRSVKARTAVTTAAVNDVGTAIDTWLHELERNSYRAEIAGAVGILDPLDGRYMLAMGDTIIVLSLFPGSKISAWSYYEPGFHVTAFTTMGGRLFVRSATTVYLYGGLSGVEYPDDDEHPVEVETPYMTASDPGKFKFWNSFMVSCENEWDVRVYLDPNDPNAYVWAGRVEGYTYEEMASPLEGGSNAAALRMVCTRGGYASFSACGMDFGTR
jgi:hypothetical protein